MMRIWSDIKNIMQSPKEIKLLGKRNSESSVSGKLSMTEKSNPLDIQNKIRKTLKPKTIFSKKQEYCTCKAKKKCSKPIAPWIQKQKKKNFQQKAM
jgi:hypothetical protein